MWIRSRKKSSGGGGGGIAITVTCDAAFAGKTITCSDGTTSFTAVCPSSSPYTVEFEGVSAGTWTISSVIDGATYTSDPIVVTDKTTVLVVKLSINVKDNSKWTTMVDTSCSIAADQNGLKYSALSGSYKGGSACYTEAIDLTGYRKILLEVALTGSLGGMVVGWSSNTNGTKAYLNDVCDGVSSALVNGHNEVDISGVSGNKYLKFGINNTTGTSVGTCTISKMELIP